MIDPTCAPKASPPRRPHAKKPEGPPPVVRYEGDTAFFARLDKDGDGTLTRPEYGQGRYGHRAMRHDDLDKDKRVTFEEYATYEGAKRLPAPVRRLAREGAEGVPLGGPRPQPPYPWGPSSDAGRKPYHPQPSEGWLMPDWYAQLSPGAKAAPMGTMLHSRPYQAITIAELARSEGVPEAALREANGWPPEQLDHDPGQFYLLPPGAPARAPEPVASPYVVNPLFAMPFDYASREK
jgi:hypothetical protein